MASNPPSTPVRIPKAATAYSSTTQDHNLRSDINHELLRQGHIHRIQETLLHSLHSSPTNWPTLIQNHALQILRSGECNTFPELMSRVMQDIREDTIAVQEAAAKSQNGSSSTNSNGQGAATGKDKEKEQKVRGSGEGGVNLALPKSVVDEGVRITRESLEGVCEVSGMAR